MNNKKGQMIMVNLLILLMTILVMVAIIPVLNSILGVAKQSDNLNCPGYDADRSGTVGDDVLDYNSTLSGSTDSIACIALALYVPYIVLAILIMGVTRALAGRLVSGETQEF